MSFENRVKEALLSVGTDYKTIWTALTGSSTGSLSSLQTADKSSLIAAINEVKASATGAPPDATTTSKGVVRLATLTEMATGVETEAVATVAGVRQERTALKNEILGGVGPAYDTLLELSQQDAADQTAVMSAIGAKADASNVYTKAEIGNVDADLAAYYAAAKA